jgi:AmmeMemoRadiSam system protein B
MTMPYQIRSEATENHKHCPTVIINEPLLDHGIAIPLFYLTRHLPNVKIVPVGFSDLDWKTHLEFGGILKEQIMKHNKRIAVIASADLSHALTNDAPSEFNTEGPIFDAKIQELLSAHNTTGILNLDPAKVSAAAECGFRSLLILLGVIRDVNFKYVSYAYEAPFGVGYLTANFEL